MSILFGIRAKNSSGTQLLHFNKCDGELHLTLTGDYSGSPIQIDFDSLSESDVEDLVYLLRQSKPK